MYYTVYFASSFSTHNIETFDAHFLLLRNEDVACYFFKELYNK